MFYLYSTNYVINITLHFDRENPLQEAVQALRWWRLSSDTMKKRQKTTTKQDDIRRKTNQHATECHELLVSLSETLQDGAEREERDRIMLVTCKTDIWIQKAKVWKKLGILLTCEETWSSDSNLWSSVIIGTKKKKKELFTPDHWYFSYCFLLNWHVKCRNV